MLPLYMPSLINNVVYYYVVNIVLKSPLSPSSICNSSNMIGLPPLSVLVFMKLTLIYSVVVFEIST